MLYLMEQDPLFIATSAPLIRWAREAWLPTRPEGPMDDDTLTHRELVVAARAIQRHLDTSLPQGPVLAIRQALETLDWRIELPYRFSTTLALPSRSQTVCRRCLSTTCVSDSLLAVGQPTRFDSTALASCPPSYAH
jgi:hypothetical protein